MKNNCQCVLYCHVMSSIVLTSNKTTETEK